MANFIEERSQDSYGTVYELFRKTEIIKVRLENTSDDKSHLTISLRNGQHTSYTWNGKNDQNARNDYEDIKKKLMGEPDEEK